MRFYLASRFGRQEELRGYRTQLANRGHDVVSRWLDETRNWSSEVVNDVPGSEGLKIGTALRNMSDVRMAEILIAFTEAPDTEGGKRGGRHVELGVALALGRGVFIIGPRENVFCWLPECRQFDTFEAFLAYLDAQRV